MSTFPADRRARPGRPRAAPASGFTLVEVLVALLIMAIMAGMAWKGVDGIVRTRDATRARLDQTLRINTVIAQWEQDLMAVQDSTIVPLALSCDGATVRITRRTPTGMQIVAWTLRPAPAGSDWIRWASPAVTTTEALQESWLHSMQLQDNEPGALHALPGLLQWQVYFYQGNGWANCQSTGDIATPQPTLAAQGSAVSASGAASGSGNGGVVIPGVIVSTAPLRQALPTGVRLVLSFAPGSGVTGDLTRDVQIGP